MKKTRLIISLCAVSGLISASANASNYFINNKDFESGYNSVGIERVEFKADNEGSLGSLNMFSVRRGYDISPYISASFSLSLPIGNSVVNTYTNTYLEGFNNEFDEDGRPIYDEIIEHEYTNEIKPTGILGADLKLHLPIHKRVEGFVTVGASYTRAKYTGYFMEDASTGEIINGIINILPAENPDPSQERCIITGGNKESSGCNPIYGFSDRYNSLGYSYGAGLNFNINKSNSFVIQYKKYNYGESLSSEGVYAGYQWRF